ncbi:hypothetical protein OESDEN_21457 [Oesophagostomum dentatum]|uniref:Uncharacterized protein n=1 Tax=Oesophagostomum dentatum TaxID=61180 RepID=A0A0B1S1U7_OESDE|nr:hypothetical protein OESDEN_21457 [Oesophagostomum dentatum]
MELVTNRMHFLSFSLAISFLLQKKLPP